MTELGEHKRKLFLTAEWRNLLMLNYPVEASLLSQYVPHGTELDTWNGSPYISLVGFLFCNTRVYGVAIPGHRNFEEVNLRFYVRRESGGELRRGVVFIREIVPRRLIAWTANLLYQENYLAAPMFHLRTVNGGEGSTLYSCGRRPRQFVFSGLFQGDPSPLAPGSPEEFFAEHYWGYTKCRDGSTNEYFVEHPSWTAWNVSGAQVNGWPEKFYGDDLAKCLSGPPQSAILAEGSPVAVYPGTRIRPA